MMLLTTLESWNNDYDSQVQATSFKFFRFVQTMYLSFAMCNMDLKKINANGHFNFEVMEKVDSFAKVALA